MTEDIKIDPINMAQSMSIGAMMIHGLIIQFIKPEDSEEDKVVATYICIAVFFHQFCTPAKHKDKMIGILEAIIETLKEPV